MERRGGWDVTLDNVVARRAALATSQRLSAGAERAAAVQPGRTRGSVGEGP